DDVEVECPHARRRSKAKTLARDQKLLGDLPPALGLPETQQGALQGFSQRADSGRIEKKAAEPQRKVGGERRRKPQRAGENSHQRGADPGNGAAEGRRHRHAWIKHEVGIVRPIAESRDPNRHPWQAGGGADHESPGPVQPANEGYDARNSAGPGPASAGARFASALASMIQLLKVRTQSSPAAPRRPRRPSEWFFQTQLWSETEFRASRRPGSRRPGSRRPGGQKPCGQATLASAIALAPRCTRGSA